MRFFALAFWLALPALAQDPPQQEAPAPQVPDAPPPYVSNPEPDSGGGGGGNAGGGAAAGGGGGGGMRRGPGGALGGPKVFSKPPPRAKPPADSDDAPAPRDPDSEKSGRGVQVAGEDDAPAPVLKRPIRAKIYKAAKDWEPLALREGGDPGRTSTSLRLKLVKVKGKLKGESATAKAQARLYRGPKDSRWLVIALFPKSLEAKRLHLELRFRLFEGFIEELVAAAITVDKNAPPSSAPRDSFQLREQGVDFVVERPGTGEIILTALDPRPGKGSFNAGRLENAQFPNRDLGFVSLSWSTRGLEGAAP